MTDLKFKNIQGAGLGFRRDMLAQLDRADLECIDFFELAPENWLRMGGQFEYNLRRYSERFPFTCHGLSLSLGSTDPLDTHLLHSIRDFMSNHGISLYTEHLSWCSHQGHLYDLLPIPFNEETAKWVAARIRQAQDILGMPIGIENSSYYFVPPGSEMSESEFINAVISDSGCYLHLDVNNLYVNSQNLGYDPVKFLHELSPAQVGYIHVAGHYQEPSGLIIDTHGADVIDPVWKLLATTYEWLGEYNRFIGTCLERDFNIPEFEVLAKELLTIKQHQCAAELFANKDKANHA